MTAAGTNPPKPCSLLSHWRPGPGYRSVPRLSLAHLLIGGHRPARPAPLAIPSESASAWTGCPDWLVLARVVVTREHIKMPR